MNKLKSLVPIILFMIGTGIFLYPHVANQIVMFFQEKEIHTYQSKLDGFEQAKIDEMFEQARIYNDNLAGDPLHDPFVLGSGYALPDNYLNVLNMGEDGIMGYIEIPKINVNMPIYHGTSDKVLQKGAGHVEGTSLPIGGKYRHSILCAHRGLPSAELFSRLDEVKEEDQFYIHVLNEIHAYKIDQIEIIEPEEINEHMALEENKDYITLMTCTPYAVNTHRLLVRGIRTEYIPEVKEEIKDTRNQNIEILIVCIAVIIFLILCIQYIKKRVKRYE